MRASSTLLLAASTLLFSPSLVCGQKDPATNVTRYLTQPSLPLLDVVQNRSSSSGSLQVPIDGHVLLTPTSGNSRSLYILNATTGSPVWIFQDASWNNTSSATNATGPRNLQMATFRGEPVLSYWVGTQTEQGWGNGRNILLNSSYGIMANFTAPGSAGSDLHEFLVTSNDTAIVSQYNPVGGMAIASTVTNGLTGQTNDSWILDGCFYELELPEATNSTFTWCASSGGVAFNETYTTPGVAPTSNETAWDWFHLNAIDKDAAGNYLVSSSYTHTVYYIAGNNGTILWRLGGKSSSFKGNGTSFSWQSDARFVGEANLTAPTLELINAGTNSSMALRNISLFNNAAAEVNGQNFNDGNQSSGLVVQLNFTGMTATLLHQYNQPFNLTLSSLKDGSASALANYPEFALPPRDTAANATNLNVASDRVVLGYGPLAYLAEFQTNGTPIALLRFGPAAADGSGGGGGSSSYRVSKRIWTGSPTDAPQVLFRNQTVFVSWNGATDILEWKLVREGSADAALVFPHVGFESSYNLSASLANLDTSLSNSTQLQVVAVDRGGKELGRTTTFFLNGTATNAGSVNGTASAAVAITAKPAGKEWFMWVVVPMTAIALGAGTLL